MSDLEEYPPEWPAVAERIKDENDWECERCGHPHDPEAGRTLTVHHLDGDKANLNDWNLAALCQKCHLQIQGKVDWYTDTLTGIHTEWLAEHVREYNEWAREHDEPELTLTGTRPNRRPYWEDEQSESEDADGLKTAPLVTDGGEPTAPVPDVFRIPTVAELDAMRTALNLSQKELSRRAGLEPQRFNTILRRDMNPQTRTMRAFLEVLQDAEPQTEADVDRRGPKPEPSSTVPEEEPSDDRDAPHEQRDPDDYDQMAARLLATPKDAVGGTSGHGGQR